MSRFKKSSLIKNEENHKVGDRVKKDHFGRWIHGTVTAVKNHRGGQKIKFKSDEHKPGELFHGGKYDLWDHSSYYKKIDSDLKKGVMRRIAPFNLDEDKDRSTLKAKSRWQDSGEQHAREILATDGMHPNARKRALHKLSGKTQSRIGANGKREFLLHRGMSRDEFDNYKKQGDSGKKFSVNTEGSSWTPDPRQARIFKDNYSENTPGVHASAWMPEEAIRFIPNQYAHPYTGNGYRHEQEVIVRHKDPIELIHNDDVEKISGYNKKTGPVINSPDRAINYRAFNTFGRASRQSGREIDVNRLATESLREKRKFGKSQLLNKSLSFVFEVETEPLEKSDFYMPLNEGDKHPSKPYVGKKHPDGRIYWHHDDDLARKNDSIIQDPKFRKGLLDRMPSDQHKKALNQIIDLVAKDPNRHFIPSRDMGQDKMRARHIKALLLHPKDAKIETQDGSIKFSMDRHGKSGGTTSYRFNFRGDDEKAQSKGPGENGDLGASGGVLSGGAMRKSGGSDFGLEGKGNRDQGQGRRFTKSSLLAKAPIIHEQEDEFTHKTLDDNAFNDHYHEMVHEEKLPNGLTHHIYKEKHHDDGIIHSLSNGDASRPVSIIAGYMEKEGPYEGYNTHLTSTDTEHQGKGLGTYLKELAVKHHGRIVSDAALSPAADRSWEKLQGKDIDVKLGQRFHGDTDRHPEEADRAAKDAHIATYRPAVSRDFKKSSLLQKGAARKLYGRFDPKKLPGRGQAGEWQTSLKLLQIHAPDYNQEDHHEARNRIPKMGPSQKLRTLNKLASKTLTRKHPKTGERQFLLFRGAGGEEAENSVSDHKVSHSEKTSWTPDPSIAGDFANEYNGNLLGAWINESDIHAAPHMYGFIGSARLDSDMGDSFSVADSKHKGPNQYHEHEIIVNPHKSMRATRGDLKRHISVNPSSSAALGAADTKDLNARITARGIREKKNLTPSLDLKIRAQNKRDFKKSSLLDKSLKNRQNEPMQKGLKEVALAGLVAMSPSAISHESPKPAPIEAPQAQKPDKKPKDHFMDRLLRTVSLTESSGGKNTNHHPLPENSIHQGTSAVGEFAITPALAQHQAKIDQALKEKHPGLTHSDLHEVQKYLEENPDAQRKVTKSFLNRLRQNFGDDPAKIGYAYFQGIGGAKKHIKEGRDIANHFHTKKFVNNFNSLQDE